LIFPLIYPAFFGFLFRRKVWGHCQPVSPAFRGDCKTWVY
jgi:hypothetical protein